MEDDGAPVPPIEDVEGMSTILAVRNSGHARAILVLEAGKGNQKTSPSPIFCRSGFLSLELFDSTGPT